MDSTREDWRRVEGWAGALLLTLCACADGTELPFEDGPALESPMALNLSLDLEGLDPAIAKAALEAHAAVVQAPRDANLRFELGLLLDANSLFEAAQEAYSQAIEIQPEHARAHYHRARVSQEIGQRNVARASLDRALELAPGYAPAHRRSAEWFLQEGEFDAARREFTRVLELEPSWPDGLLGLSQLALLSEQAEEARSTAAEVLAAHPGNPFASHLLGSALRDLGRVEEAELAFARAGDGIPVWRDPWVDEMEARLGGHRRLMVEAKACLERGLYEDACSRLARLHAEAPDDVTIQGMWTAALTKLSRYDEALGMLQAARARQPEHFRIELNLAIVRWKQRQLDLALGHLARAAELNPNHEAVLMVLGEVLTDRQDAAGAALAFEQALRAGGEPKRVLPRLGRLQMSMQRWTAAAETYHRASQAFPLDASMQATLAGCLLEAGDLEGARVALARSRAIDPSEQLLPMIEARMSELKDGKQP